MISFYAWIGNWILSLFYWTNSWEVKGTNNYLNILKTGKSVESTVQDIKKRALRLLGQQNRAEMCLYPVNSKKQCKSYKDVDAAAQAACDLIR